MAGLSQAQDLSSALSHAAVKYQLDLNQLSFFVQEVEAKQPLLSFNAHLAQNPASLMKLLSTYAGLEILGPTYTWKTRLMTQAPIKKGVLQGTLYFKGGGDPNFRLDHLWLMLRALRQQGIKKLDGPLIVDRSFFTNSASQLENTFVDQENWRAYHVNADAALVNLKASVLQFWPEPTGLKLQLDPPDSSIQIETDVRLSAATCPGLWRKDLQLSFNENRRLQIKGQYFSDCGPRNWYLNLQTPDAYLKSLWLDVWQSLGGAVDNKFEVISGVAPENGRVLYEAVSPSLSEVIRSINKLSNNVMAQQLFLTLQAQARLTNEQAPASAELLKHWLKQKSFNTEQVVIENGSGLSRNQRLSAALLGSVLIEAYHSALMPEFLASLPIVGLDGTMKSRLNAEAVQGQARIKTGSLDQVKAIAGYVFAASGKKYVVVSIMNGGDAQATQQLHDYFLQQVYQLAP